METNAFQHAVEILIDDHYTFLQTDEAKKFRENLGDDIFAHEFRTLKVSGRRQCGHSTLAKHLAYGVGDYIGRKYSTIIVSPSIARASHNYGHASLYFNENDINENDISVEYAIEYRNILGHNNPFGKATTIQRMRSIGFNRKKELNKQRDAIFQLTGKKIERFDLMLIDGTYKATSEDIDFIISTYSLDVELFVILQ